jgi:hypothetical protein
MESKRISYFFKITELLPGAYSGWWWKSRQPRPLHQVWLLHYDGFAETSSYWYLVG